MGASEQGLHHHFVPILQPNQTKIVTLNANATEIFALDPCYGQLDKNCHFKCKYLGNVTSSGPLGTVTA